jgi:type IV pilus assembly protein PilC
LKLPIVGGILGKIYQATFCNLMYLLTTSKVPLLDSIRLMGDVIQFYPYQQAFAQIQEELIIGTPLSQSIARHSIFEKRLVALVKVGEEVNKLDDMFGKLYQQQTTELEHRIKIVGNVLEPILIILVGIFVAFVLVAMYLPMFRLGSTIN